MRIHARTIAAAFSLLCLAGAPALASQDRTPPPQQQPPQAQAPAAANHQTLSGDLSKVDTAAKSITVKSAEGAETVIAYNDKTEVTGAKGVAGLATMTDQKVTVTFTEDAMTKAKTATKIAVQARAQ